MRPQKRGYRQHRIRDTKSFRTVTRRRRKRPRTRPRRFSIREGRYESKSTQDCLLLHISPNFRPPCRACAYAAIPRENFAVSIREHTKPWTNGVKKARCKNPPQKVLEYPICQKDRRYARVRNDDVLRRYRDYRKGDTVGNVDNHVVKSTRANVARRLPNYRRIPRRVVV